MNIAILSDIHGNLVALDKVLAELTKEQVEQIICLGDVAAGGPQPRQALQRLQELACPVMMGNTDAWLLRPEIGTPQSLFAQRSQEIGLWCSEQLSDADKTYIQTFQSTLSYTLPQEKQLLCYHGSPRSYREKILANTPDEVLEQAFSERHADVMAGGHTHIQLYRRYRDILVLNPGSVGMAMDRAWPLEQVHNEPWAEYSILRIVENVFTVEMRRVAFDLEAFIEAIHSSGMPHAEWLAHEWNSK